ncbi:hypothetical protein PO909_018072 [Leuciscus waleckii]
MPFQLMTSLTATADTKPTPTVETEPEPTTDRVPVLLPATDKEPEPMPTTEPEPAALSIPEWKPAIQSDHVFELVVTSEQVEILVELEVEDLLLIPGSPSCIAVDVVPTQPPSPASSAKMSQSLWSRLRWLPLVPRVLPPQIFRSPALPCRVDSLASPLDAKPLTPPRPIDQSAPPWLLTPLSSTKGCRPHSSNRLPHPSGPTLVRHHSACATDFQDISCGPA